MTNQSRNAIAEFEESVELPDSWTVEKDGRTLTFDYEAVPESRLQRQSPPGIDVNYIRGMWMLASHDSIARGFDRDHQGVLARGKSIDCQHRDDAVSAIEHAMERVEEFVGEELQDGHSKPRLMTDGGQTQSRKETPKLGPITEEDYPDEQVETGERVMQSPVTGTEYLVTKWVEKSDGRAIALEKEELDDD